MVLEKEYLAANTTGGMRRYMMEYPGKVKLNVRGQMYMQPRRRPGSKVRDPRTDTLHVAGYLSGWVAENSLANDI